MLLKFLIFTLCLFSPEWVYAKTAFITHTDPMAPMIFGTTGLLFFAFMGRIAARKLNQPAVLGELMIGILIGNLFYHAGFQLILILREGPAVFDIMHYVLQGNTLEQSAHLALGNSTVIPDLLAILRGPHGNSLLQVAQVVEGISTYGIIFLLFLVGLETSTEELKRVGGASLRVAIIGVILPVGLGFFLMSILAPEYPYQTDLFIAATLAATSVSISAAVLKDMKLQKSVEAHTILGAAVIDDVLGLVILTLVTGIVIKNRIDLQNVIQVITLSTLFLVAIFLGSKYILRAMVSFLKRLEIVEAKLFVAFIYVMVLAWLASAVGLATIIGAFAAGLLLHDGYFTQWGDVNKHRFTIKDLVAPLEAILVPVFFILIGIQVKLESFASWNVLALAFGLVVVAIIGKLASGYGANPGSNRLAIGIGMIPRGEVGLVFVSLGKNLDIIPDQLFSSIVLMVIITTLLSPPLLKWQLSAPKRQHGKSK